MVPIKGLDKKLELTYTYTIEIESLSAETHPSLITSGELSIRSAEPMGWRLGQTMTLTLAEVPVKEDVRDKD